MLKLVEEHGTRYWALIGAKLNGRTGKQVINRMEDASSIAAMNALL